MGLVTVYDPEGIPHEKESVDARECVTHCGFTMQPPAPKADSPAPVDPFGDAQIAAAKEAAEKASAEIDARIEAERQAEEEAARVEAEAKSAPKKAKG